MTAGAKNPRELASKIGRKAGVVVNSEGKPASAHDFRRSFGTRWAKRVRPPVLQLLMRHESIETTLTHYVALDADELAEELWDEYGPSDSVRDQIDRETTRSAGFARR